jgi:hypothetical protein
MRSIGCGASLMLALCAGTPLAAQVQPQTWRPVIVELP